jgi:REP element-mobilizing transposase RayT
MTYDPQAHRRRSIRVPAYDSSEPGAYFITICSHRREVPFEIENATMVPNAFGQIVHEVWRKSAEVRPNVALDAFVVKPNHGHGMLYVLERIEAGDRATGPVAPTVVPERRLRSDSLGSIVGQGKSVAAKRIDKLRRVGGVPAWQRNYYERIIRSDHSLDRIRDYFAANPARWAEDRYYVAERARV